MTSSTKNESSNSEMDDSFKAERRDRKKHRRITNKKDKTSDDIRKLNILSAKLKYYDKIKQLRNMADENKGPIHEQETDDEFLNKAFNENNKYWEKEYERRKIEEEEVPLLILLLQKLELEKRLGRYYLNFLENWQLMQ